MEDSGLQLFTKSWWDCQARVIEAAVLYTTSVHTRVLIRERFLLFFVFLFQPCVLHRTIFSLLFFLFIILPFVLPTIDVGWLHTKEKWKLIRSSTAIVCMPKLIDAHIAYNWQMFPWQNNISGRGAIINKLFVVIGANGVLEYSSSKHLITESLYPFGRAVCPFPIKQGMTWG